MALFERTGIDSVDLVDGATRAGGNHGVNALATRAYHFYTGPVVIDWSDYNLTSCDAVPERVAFTVHASNPAESKAVIFEKTGHSGSWAPVATLTPSAGSYGYGLIHASSLGPTTLVVSATGSDITYVYELVGGVWGEQATIPVGGAYVSYSDDRVVISKLNNLYVYKRTAGIWSLEDTLACDDSSYVRVVLTGTEILTLYEATTSTYMKYWTFNVTWGVQQTLDVAAYRRGTSIYSIDLQRDGDYASWINAGFTALNVFKLNAGNWAFDAAIERPYHYGYVPLLVGSSLDGPHGHILLGQFDSVYSTGQLHVIRREDDGSWQLRASYLHDQGSGWANGRIGLITAAGKTDLQRWEFVTTCFEGGGSVANLNFFVGEIERSATDTVSVTDSGDTSRLAASKIMPTRIPTALAHIDMIRLSTESGNPVVCCRFPAPVIPPWTETTGDEPFALANNTGIKVTTEHGSQFVSWYRDHFGDIANATAAEVVTEWNAQCSLAVASISYSGTRVHIVGDGILELSGTGLTAVATQPGLYLKPIREQIIAEAKKDEAISLRVCDTGSSGFERVRIWVNTAGVDTLVYDSQDGSVAAGWIVCQQQSKSPGAVTNDVWDFSLEHAAYFVSEETVTLTVTARTVGAQETTSTSSFIVEDYVRPTVESVKPWTPRMLRVKFSEVMDQSSSSTTSVLYTRQVSTGDVTFHAVYETGLVTYYNVIEAVSGEFIVDEQDCYIGSVGAQAAANNGSFKILERLSATLIRVDGNLEDEGPVDPTKFSPPRLYVSPYRVVALPAALPTIQPMYSPVVIDAALVDLETLAPGENVAQYVQLELDDELTPNLSTAYYRLDLADVEDEAGNLISGTINFTSWTPNQVPRRSFRLWDLIPEINKSDDTSQDLERFVRSIDEVTQVMLKDVDDFGSLLDPTATKVKALDAMLAHLGCPFTFINTLSAQKKRDLVPLLVPMYKQKGTSKGIENAVLFFLGKTVTVTPWYIPTDTWELGESELGFNTYLGPSQSFVRYSFYLDHTEELTAAQQAIITEIVNAIRPAHTHFKGFRLLSVEATEVGASDMLYVLDSARRICDKTVVVSDAVVTTDRAATTHNRILADTVSVTDQVAVLQPADAVVVSELVNRAADQHRKPADAESCTDAILISRGEDRSGEDSCTATDTLTRDILYGAQPVDSETVAETLVRSTDTVRRITDSISLGYRRDRYATYGRGQADSIAVADVSPGIRSDFGRPIEESISTSDDVARTVS